MTAGSKSQKKLKSRNQNLTLPVDGSILNATTLSRLFLTTYTLW